jgi:hypothetical protein
MATKIIIISQIDSTHNGPVAKGPNRKEQKIHIQQGDVDGACGPYCLLISLLICGVIWRTEVTSLAARGSNKSFSEFLERIDKFSSLFREGTDIDDLRKLIRKNFRKEIKACVKEKCNKDIVEFVKDHIHTDHPVILGLDFRRGGHWVVVVGLEYIVRKSGDEELCRFLVLDPSDPAPKVSAWNGVIDARQSTKGRYPYEWWTAKDTKVNLDEAIAIWRE